MAWGRKQAKPDKKENPEYALFSGTVGDEFDVAAGKGSRAVCGPRGQGGEERVGHRAGGAREALWK